MGKKIELLYLKPTDRVNYPNLKSKSELKKMKLMPGRNVKPRALVVRKMYDNYYLWDINKTVAYRESLKEKQQRKLEKKKRDEATTCVGCGIKYNYSDIMNDYVPFKNRERLCEKCYFKTFQEYKNGIVYDIETTGLYYYHDEILSLCIMDLEGNVLFEKYFRPERITSWDKAMEINNITPQMVEDEKPISYYKEEIQNIFDSADILITYNGIQFDDAFLREAGIQIPKVPQFDVMLEFAWSEHVWDRRHNSWKWFSLTDCAESYGYSFSAHDAHEDVKATLYCYKKMVFT